MIWLSPNLFNYPDIVLLTSMIYTKAKQDQYWDQKTWMNKISNGPKKVCGQKVWGAKMSGGRNVQGPKCPGAEMSGGQNV